MKVYTKTPINIFNKYLSSRYAHKFKKRGFQIRSHAAHARQREHSCFRNSYKYIALASALLPLMVQARPVSYPGGWTAMQMHSKDETSLHVHYSPTARYSVGGKAIHFSEDDMTFSGVQLNNLVKRWNMPDAQANVYLKSGVGVLTNEDEQNAAAFTGIAADIEDRRYFASYENRVFEGGDMDASFKQSARLGFAPYVAEFGGLHTWLMLQVDHAPEDADTIEATPLVRFFKGSSLLEVGNNLNGGMTINFIQRF